jgi:aryl-alcohol dehydrogenase-like predicted oxidoreductase
MEYRLLGRTNLNVSAISIGSWQLSGSLTLDGKVDGYPDVGRDQVISLIHACEDLGINLIDCAEIYGAGEGESRIGEAIHGRRDRWILSTKFGLRQGKTNERIIDSTPKTIRASLEGSLRRLQTDYIDVYLYHTPPKMDCIDEGKEVLETLRKEGKLRFYGISTNDEVIVKQLINKNAIDVVMFSQSLMIHPLGMLDLIKKHNLGSLIRGAFQGGLLSGRYFHHRPLLSKEDIRHLWMSNIKTEEYAVFEKYIPEGASMVTLALRYLLDFDTTHSIVLGGKDVSDYRNAVEVFELNRLDLAVHNTLKKVGQTLKKSYSRSQFKRKIIEKMKKIIPQ